MSKGVVVGRLEEGDRAEFYFKNLKDALNFIVESEKKKKTEDGYEIDGVYEIWVPRSNN